MSINEICLKLKELKKWRKDLRQSAAKDNNLGFKFNSKPIRKHGIRIAWNRDNIESRIANCLVCGKKSEKCICKIEISNNQIHF